MKALLGELSLTENEIKEQEAKAPENKNTQVHIPQQEVFNKEQNTNNSPKAKTPAAKPNPESELIAARNQFNQKAADIENYTATYLDTAMDQSEMNHESAIVGEKWDKLLNETYAYLKTILSDEEFKNLESDELSWIAEKEAAVKNAGAQFAGGTAETLEKNMVYIQYTKDRCYYLISLI